LTTENQKLATQKGEAMQLEVINRKPAGGAVNAMPLLFIHGAWHGAWCWDEYFLPYFAQQGYNSYALSLRGHAGSPKVKPLFLTATADYVADVSQVVAQIEQETGKHPVLIGHSMGGYVTQKYLERANAPAGVLVASLPHTGTFWFILRAMMRHPLVYLRSLWTVSLYPLLGTPQLLREWCFSPDIPPEQLNRYFALIGNESWRMGLEALVFTLPRPQRVKTPLLVVGAENDAIFMVREEEAMARAYNAEIRIFPNMAHDMMLEKDWQTVADYIIGWLKGRGF
jgi:pimeloyl-ACP methyl ester carboxylesterase